MRICKNCYFFDGKGICKHGKINSKCSSGGLCGRHKWKYKVLECKSTLAEDLKTRISGQKIETKVTSRQKAKERAAEGMNQNRRR